MKKISLDEIADGMVLAQPITGPNGNVLLATGAQLRASLAGRLGGYGVTFVIIEGDDGSPEEPLLSPELLEERLRGIFAGKLGSPLMHMIFDEVLQHRKGNK